MCDISENEIIYCVACCAWGSGESDRRRFVVTTSEAWFTRTGLRGLTHVIGVYQNKYLYANKVCYFMIALKSTTPFAIIVVRVFQAIKELLTVYECAETGIRVLDDWPNFLFVIIRMWEMGSRVRSSWVQTRFLAPAIPHINVDVTRNYIKY